MVELAEITVHMTESAEMHFSHLLEKEKVRDMALRIFLDHPGLPTAEVGISFCPPGDSKPTDISLNYNGFTLFVDRASAPYLEEANIDYIQDKLGGQLSIKAPHLRGHKPAAEDSLYERVTYILNNEVNPNLAHHGGVVSLVEITDDFVVVLKFGGGCHGCGMVDVTLKQGIERSLLEQIPEITAVRDVTDHATGENPYC